MAQMSISLLEFQERFCDEESCLAHLFRIRWPDGFSCPSCGHDRFSFVKSRRLYQCSACKRQTSVTAGTVFHKTRTPIRKWFWMIFMMTRQKSGVSMLRMQKLLKIGAYRTAWLMGHKIRQAMLDRDSRYKLAGLIELDSVLIGPKKPGNRGDDGKRKAKVLIGVDLQSKKAGFRILEGRSGARSNSIESRGSDRTGSKGERPDLGWIGHGASGTQRSEPGHEQFVGRARGLSKVRWICAVIANIKGNIRGVHHGVSAKHLQRYLSEYIYRFNLRRLDSKLFDLAVASCLNTMTVTFAEVTI